MLSVRTWCLQDGLHRGVIGNNRDLMTIKVGVEVLHTPNYSKSLQLCNTVVSLRRGQRSKATGWSFPLFCCCDRTAPRPLMLASVSSTNGLSKSGYTRTGAQVSFSFSFSNDSWHSGVQTKEQFFLVRLWRGDAILAKPSMKRL